MTSVSESESSFVGTPFNPRTAPLNINQRWIAWDKYHVVDAFTSFEMEYAAIRHAAASIDMSPLSKYEIAGPDAQRFVDCLITRDATKQEVGQIYYTPWCNERGKVVGDGMVFRIDENCFRLSTDPQYQWLTEHADGYDVEIVDISDDYANLALQGPNSQRLLEATTGMDWSDLKFSRIRATTINDERVSVMRQGFTGEHGYELWMKAESAVAVWDAVYLNAAGFGLHPAGYHALDVARIEAGFIIVGPDYSGAGSDALAANISVDEENQASPYELGLSKFVDLRKEDFIGKTALQKSRNGRARKTLTGISIEWQGIADLYTSQGLPPTVVAKPIWYPLNVFNSGSKIGRATSIAWSPAVNSIIGFAFLHSEFSAPGSAVAVEFQVGDKSGLANAKVTPLPHTKIKRNG